MPYSPRTLHLVALLCLLPGFAGCQSSSPPDEQPAELRRLIEDWAADPSIPGVLLRVESADGVIFDEAAGFRALGGGEPALSGDYFRTASVGKLFTAVTVLRLAEEALLDLKDPISKYIEADLIGRLHVREGVSMGHAITVEHLLSHTSGLPNSDNDPAFQEFVIGEPERHRTPMDLLQFVIGHEALFDPGAAQSYSSPGYWLLGLVIESATGQSYHEAVRQYVLDPLDLEQTYEETNELPPGIAVNASYFGELDLSGIHPSFEYADGGFVTTTADLTKFGLALAAGRPFENRATYENMMRPRGDRTIGLGAFVQTTDAGETIFSHDGFWGIGLFVYADRPLAVAYAINQAEPEEWGTMVRRIVRAAAR